MSGTDFILTQDIAAHGGCPSAPCCGSLDLRLGDCMDVMRTFPDGHFDLAIVDPPYGINVGKMNLGIGKGKACPKIENRKWKPKSWDDAPPDQAYFDELFRVSKRQVIWGGNYFTLPPSQYFAIWDKGAGMRGRSFAEGEFAWVSDGGTRIKTLSPVDKERIHPTQKPVELYDWLLANYAKPGMRVLDTHLGSGSHAIASHYAGIHLTACEIDADYYEAAKVRIARETSQTELFIHHNTHKLMDADLSPPESTMDAPRRSMQRLVRHLDLFSGIGGFALAAQWVGGIETVAFCEIDPWARRVLAKNFPNVPINGDVKTLNPQDYGRIDLITGGYPCQPFSVAGQRKGSNDDRHLWPQVFRILQQARPRWMLCENVAGHIDLGLDEVLSDLASASYTAEAIVIPACALNAIHRRDRVWIIANADSERGDELLPERVLEEYHASREIQSGGGRFSEAWGHSTRETASRILRTDDGVSGGVDRNRGLGNAIVPQVAAEILRAMMAVDRMSNNALFDSPENGPQL